MRVCGGGTSDEEGRERVKEMEGEEKGKGGKGQEEGRDRSLEHAVRREGGVGEGGREICRGHYTSRAVRAGRMCRDGPGCDGTGRVPAHGRVPVCQIGPAGTWRWDGPSPRTGWVGRGNAGPNGGEPDELSSGRTS